jgi:abequosyltransferase
MLENLKSGCDIYLCGLTLCTLDMQLLGDHRVSRIKTDSQFDLGLASDRRAYFRRAQTTTAFFSFAGSLIIKKSRWDAIGLDEEFVGSLWAHVARIFQMIPGGLRLHYLPAPYLFKRTENDSFMDKGLVHRYAIAIDGYHRLASACFPAGSQEARHIRRALTNEFAPWVLLDLKFTTERERPDDVPNLDRLAAKVYGDPTPRNRIYHLIYQRTPRAAFRSVQAAYRAVRSVRARFTTLRRPALRAAER